MPDPKTMTTAVGTPSTPLVRGTGLEVLGTSNPPVPKDGMEPISGQDARKPPSRRHKAVKKKVHRTHVSVQELMLSVGPDGSPQTPRIGTYIGTQQDECNRAGPGQSRDLLASTRHPSGHRREPKHTMWTPLPLLGVDSGLSDTWESPVCLRHDNGAPIHANMVERAAAAFDRQWERAAELDAHPPNQSLFYYGYCLDKAGRWNEALAVYRAVLDCNPLFWAAAFNIARLLSRSSGDPAPTLEIQKLLEQALQAQQDAPTAKVALALADCLLSQGDAVRALGIYRRTLERCQDVSPAELLRARIGVAACAARSGSVQTAYEAYGAALRADPGNGALRYNRAVLSMRLQRWSRAAAELGSLIKADATLRPQALHALAVLCSTLGFRTRAEQAAKRAVDLEPSNCRFLLTHARTLRALGMHDEALRAASSVLDLEPSHTKARRIRAACHRVLGHPSAALRDLDLILTGSPSSKTAHDRCCAGFCCAQLGDVESAAWHFEVALQLDPSLHEAAHNLAMCRDAARRITH